MSRFANLSNTGRIAGPCRCDGKPHPDDWVEIIAEMPYGAEGLIGAAGWASDKVYNFHAARLKLLELAIVRWNFLGPTGESWDPTSTSIALLDKETVEWLAKEIDLALKGKGKLPNASAGKSPDGSSGTPSRSRGIPARASSTTSS